MSVTENNMAKEVDNSREDIGYKPPRRIPYVDRKLAAKIEKYLRENIKKPVKTHSRSCTILPNWIGLTIMVHNGRTYIAVTIDERMVGMKLGAFAPTRKFTGHSSNNK